MQSLQPNSAYHIFNHANGFENILNENKNYRFFLEKYILYISPIAETYAYCLMPNHFHLVIKIRKREIIEDLIRSKLSSSSISPFPKIETLEKLIKNDDDKINIKQIELFLSKQFSNFFSSYTQAFNKMYKRRGSLSIKNFKRTLISNDYHLINAITYTHRNPIHHRFRKNFEDYEYRSYNLIINKETDFIDSNIVLNIFENKEEFLNQHQISLERFDDIEN